MRIEGTLEKWNDERGFGFITPTRGGAEVFAHISAFPRDGQRPRLGERVTFEVGVGKDGRHQARNILCPERPSPKPYRLSEPARGTRQRSLLGRLLPIAFLLALGVYGYAAYSERSQAQSTDALLATEAVSPSAISPSFRCDGRTHCSQMTSCAEARFFLRNCPGVQMDGNHDGEPCEQQWCH